jgi:GGDEF domain-containing protein
METSRDVLHLSVDGVAAEPFTKKLETGPPADQQYIEAQADEGGVLLLELGQLYGFASDRLLLTDITSELGLSVGLLISVGNDAYNGRGSNGLEFDLGLARWRVLQIDERAQTVRIQRVPDSPVEVEVPDLTEDELHDVGISLVPEAVGERLFDFGEEREQNAAAAVIYQDIASVLDLLALSFPDSVLWIGQYDEEEECLRVTDRRGSAGFGPARGDTFPLDDTLCATVTAEEDEVHLEDVPASEFAALPFSERFGIGSYLGVNLRPGGIAVGSLAIAHPDARSYGLHHEEMIEAAADIVSRCFERLQREERLEDLHATMRAQASADPSTGLPNRAAFLPQLQREWDRVRRTYGSGDAAGSWIVVFSVDRRREPFATALERECRTSDMAARIGESEFAALLVDCHSPQPFLARLGRALGDFKDEVLVSAIAMQEVGSALEALEDAEAQLTAPEDTDFAL